MDECLLCSAERVTPWLFEDEVCWIAVSSAAPRWWSGERTACPTRSSRRCSSSGSAPWRAATADGYWIDEATPHPGHWHAHARPAGGFFDPATDRRRFKLS